MKSVKIDREERTTTTQNRASRLRRVSLFLSRSLCGAKRALLERFVEERSSNVALKRHSKKKASQREYIFEIEENIYHLVLSA